jgi:hypothetical protein
MIFLHLCFISFFNALRDSKVITIIPQADAALTDTSSGFGNHRFGEIDGFVLVVGVDVSGLVVGSSKSPTVTIVV